MQRVLDSGEFPLILGGDCTILLGPMLALRRRGRYGLLFIDGNADFFQPEAEPNGEGASMDLAWVTGHGPHIVTDHEGFHPLVRAEDVVAVGFRDHDDQREYESQPLPAALTRFDLPGIRSAGIEAAMWQAVDYLDSTGIEGFLVHLDADVLDDEIMPAVDFRMPGGLSRTELVTALRIALSSKGAVGMEVTIYNPALDQDGAAGRLLCDLLADSLAHP